MATTASRAIALAVQQKGIGEDPPGSNANKFSAWYWGPGTHGSAYSWCAVFVMWVFENLDSRELVPWSASCSAMVREWKSRGQWLGATRNIRQGDIFYIPGGPTGWEHVGFVANTHSDGTFTSIEGNWANGVRQVRRQTSRYSFARPAYGVAEMIATASTEKLARFPGADWFRTSPRHALVTEMGKRLVAVDCSRYAEGPGPQWSDADKASYAAWQRKLGYTGSDADGWPGQESWDKLQVPNPGYREAPAPKPAPAPAPKQKTTDQKVSELHSMLTAIGTVGGGDLHGAGWYLAHALDTVRETQAQLDTVNSKLEEVLALLEPKKEV